MSDTSIPFQIHLSYGVDDFRREKTIHFILKKSGFLGLINEDSDVKLSDKQLLKLRKLIDKTLDELNPRKDVVVQKYVRDGSPYSLEWLRHERARCLELERYEDIKALDYLVTLVQKARAAKNKEGV